MGGIVTLKILFWTLLVFVVMLCSFVFGAMYGMSGELNFFKFCRDFFLMKPKNYKFFEKEKEDSAD